MKKLLTIIVFLVLTQGVFASKAMISKMVVTLQDGTTRVVSLRGDEHFSYFASSRGELIIRENNTWRVASIEEEREAIKQINDVAAQRKAANKADETIIANHPFPSVGHPKALVILVSFADCDFEYTADDIDKLFNSTEINGESGLQSYASLAQYMDECSNGIFRPEFDIVGPYKLSGTVEDYGKNSNGTDANVSNFIKDACEAAHDEGNVDFSQYDADEDGYVDLVYIVYAGFGENWGENPDYCLWPKSGTGNYGTYDGVTVNRYGINQELAGYDDLYNDDGMHYLNGIGVLAHEFCHTMGLFDVYPTVLWTDISWYDNQSMEIWSLMDYGENNYNGYYPTPLTAWERELFGWLTIDILDTPSDITLTPLQDGGKAYKILNDNDPSGQEFYILESIPNGSGTGFYRRMRGNGMLITHINYDTDYFSNFSDPNNVHGEPRLTIVPADGIIMTSYRLSLDEDDPLYITSQEYYADHAGDTYPGTTNSSSFDDYKAYNGTIDKPLTEIQQEGWTVSFLFCGGAQEDDIHNIDADRKQNNNLYNLKGQKVNASYKGIVIQNGKKHIQ